MGAETGTVRGSNRGRRTNAILGRSAGARADRGDLLRVFSNDVATAPIECLRAIADTAV